MESLQNRHLIGNNFMKIVAFITFLLVVHTTDSQNRNIHVESYQSPDSSWLYIWRMELAEQIDLDSIQNSEHATHFRLWTKEQVIDVWECDDGGKFGRLTSWTAKFSEEYDFNNQKIYFKTQSLDSSTTASLLNLIDSSAILTILNADTGGNWGIGFDGITYIMESADNENYFFKSYWTPEAQDSLHEAVLVQNFIDQSLSLADADDVWAEFASTIPFECYINGGPMITCQFLTPRKKRRKRKGQKNKS